MSLVYILVAVALVVLGFAMWNVWYSKKAESFYSTVAPLKNFPEVIGLPLIDARAYLTKHADKYQIRTVSTYDDSYRQDLSTIYIVVDGSSRVTDVL